MKRIFPSLAALLTLLINYTSVARQKPDTYGKSLLWSITGKQLTKPSYLFGTIHLICVEDYIWTKQMKESLEKSDKVCFEMALNDPAVMMQVAGGLIDHSGKKLEDYFTPVQFALIKKYITDSLSMDVAMFANLKPIALQSIIGTAGLNCANPISYEDSIMKTALKDNKEILGLEAPQEQLNVLENIPTDTVISQLMDELQNSNKNDTEYLQLIAAYKDQDLPTLYKLITTSNELGDNMDKFLDDRNKKWIARMNDKMQRSSVFFAVGAGHLWGDNGVISLLRKDGYTVQPVQ